MRTPLVALGLAVLMVASSCGPEAGVSLPNGDGSAVIAHITDKSGLVTGAASAPLPFPALPINGVDVSNPHGDRRTLRVAWRGSVCPGSLDVVISGTAARLDVQVTEDRTTCVTQEDGHRWLDLTLSEPVDAAGVTFGVAKDY